MSLDWTWANVALVAAVGWAGVVLIRWHLDRANTYDVRDLLRDHATGKASLDKHIVLGFAVLSAWVVVSRQLAGKEVETLLLGVLGIFILQRAAAKALDTYAARDVPRELPRVADKERL